MAQSDQVVTKRKTGPLNRVSSEDFAIATEILRAAAHYLVPDELSQRQAFAKFMPDLYVLRNKGCSWSQLAALLKQCNLNLQPSSVRTYYSEMIAGRLDECQRRMNEQILLMAEVRKETRGVDVSTIADKLATIATAQREAAAKKIDHVFAIDAIEIPKISPPPPSAAAREPASQPARAERSRQHSLASGEEPGVPTLNDTPAAPAQSDKPTPPAKPAVNKVEKNLAASPRPENPKPSGNLSCKPLQPGIKSLPRKENVPPNVYEAGNLEHPAIPGLMLNREQRLYGAALEIVDGETGELRLETIHEKRFRVLWKKPVPMTQSSTGDSFVKMDNSLFGKNTK